MTDLPQTVLQQHVQNVSNFQFVRALNRAWTMKDLTPVYAMLARDKVDIGMLSMAFRRRFLRAVDYFNSEPDSDEEESSDVIDEPPSAEDTFRSHFWWHLLLAFLEDGRILASPAFVFDIVGRSLCGNEPTLLLPIVTSLMTDDQWWKLFKMLRKLPFVLRTDTCQRICDACFALCPNHMRAKQTYVRMISPRAIRRASEIGDTIWANCHGDNIPKHVAFLEPIIERLRYNFFGRAAHDLILDITLALMPLQLPSYVIMWITEWLPEVVTAVKSPQWQEHIPCSLIINVNENFRYRRALPGETKRLKT